MIFTATDGTKFEDRNAWRCYEFETNYTFRNKQGETLMKLPGKIGGCVYIDRAASLVIASTLVR